MPIAREGQFLVSHDLSHVPMLGLESKMLNECVNEIERLHFKGVFGSSVFGFNEKSLDALKGITRLEAVWFWDVALKNVDALYAFPGLRHFGIHPKRPALDFSNFPELQTMVWSHKPTDQGTDSLSALVEMYVWHFKSKDNTFAGLRLPQTLQSLEINWANTSYLPCLASSSPSNGAADSVGVRSCPVLGCQVVEGRGR